MTYVGSHPDTLAAHGRVVVRRPQLTDALGATLRDAFDAQPRLPAEWRSALETLDRSR